MWYQTPYAPPEQDPHSKSSSASRQVQRQMSDPALMHSHVQLHQGDNCITEHNNQRVPCSYFVLYLEKSQFLWQEQPCQLVESHCTERTGLLLPELSSHAKLFPAMPFSTHFVSSECSPATFMCTPPVGGPFQATQATRDERSGSTVHSAYLCPCHCKNWEYLNW